MTGLIRPFRLVLGHPISVISYIDEIPYSILMIERVRLMHSF